jgi:cobaltochelatase CobT
MRPSAEFIELQARVAEAISGTPDVTVLVGLNHATDAPLENSERIVVATQEDASAQQQRYVRGQVDMAALALKHHHAVTHRRFRPADPKAASVFDALELVRLEAIGGEHMQGVKHNLDARVQVQCAQFEGAEIPTAQLLALSLRQEWLGTPPPEPMQQAVASVQPLVARYVSKNRDVLQQHVHQQVPFAKAMQHFLVELELMAKPSDLALDSLPDDDTQTMDSVGHSRDEASEDAQLEEEASPEPLGSDDAGEEESGEDNSGTSEGESTELAPEDNGPPIPTPMHNQPVFSKDIQFTNYSAFTTQFDEVVPASALASGDELMRLYEQLQQKLRQYHTVSSRLATRLQRLLLAQQAREWMYELDDGMIDNARLARIVVRPDIRDIYKQEKDTDFRDTVVTLLIDNSGSMRGRPITIAALSADIMARTLERCGVKVEVLGFTTRDWKGGQTRKYWLEQGRPAEPGRLNDLRHIIYKSADQRFSRARRHFAVMLKEGLLKENIDGEAILWAYQRLKSRREHRRILMVISDGAPVDDSTLSANSGGYLDRHLRDVIGMIEKENVVELLAIGIGHDVTRYYQRAVTLHDAEQLGDAMVNEITDLFKPRARQS